MLTLDDAMNAYVFASSMLAAWLVARTDKWHRWGYVAGLASEPGWLYIAWLAKSWGVLLLTLWWAGLWGVGAYRRFGKSAS